MCCVHSAQIEGGNSHAMQSCARSPDTLIPGQCIHSRARAVGCMAGLVLVCVQSAQAFYFSINVSSSQSSICSDGMRASLCWVRIGIRARIHGGTFHPAWNIFTVRRRAVLRNCSGGIGAGPPWHGDHARVPRLAAESTCSPMLRARPANHRPPRPPGSPNEGTQGFQGAACKFDGGCGPVRARGVSSAESHPKWGCVCVHRQHTHPAWAPCNSLTVHFVIDFKRKNCPVPLKTKHKEKISFGHRGHVHAPLCMQQRAVSACGDVHRLHTLPSFCTFTDAYHCTHGPHVAVCMCSTHSHGPGHPQLAAGSAAWHTSGRTAPPHCRTLRTLSPRPLAFGTSADQLCGVHMCTCRLRVCDQCK